MIIIDHVSKKTQNMERKFLNFPFSSRANDLRKAYDKRHLFLRRLTARKVINVARAAASFMLGIPSPKVPPFLKIEATRLCQLRCPTCIHGRVGGTHPIDSDREMDFDLFKGIIDACKKDAIVVSLYNNGESLLAKNFIAMAAYAEQAGLNTYVTSNFSIRLSENDLERIVRSGLTSLIIALDGFSQDTYGKTRVNGRFDYVVSNLERLIQVRTRLGSKFPLVQVQSLIFEHNRHEKDKVLEFCQKIGVDVLRFDCGFLTPYATPAKLPAPKSAKRQSWCAWPFFSAIIRQNGDVVPCCMYRLHEPFDQGCEPITMGRIGQRSLGDIFTGEQYKYIREHCRNPSFQYDNEELEFCYGCHMLYQNTRQP